jgi:hypothetical protein
LLTAAGYAAVFPERSLNDPALEAAQRAVSLVLSGHEPYPAMAIDHHWMMLASNRTIKPLVAGVAQKLLEPPVKVLRLGLHPGGLSPRIANLQNGVPICYRAFGIRCRLRATHFSLN